MFLKKNPSQRRSKEVFNAILEANVELLEKEDYDKITVSKIVEHSGVTSGSIYQYFKNKKDILKSSVYYFFEKLMLNSLNQHKLIQQESLSKKEFFEKSLKYCMSLYFSNDLRTKQIFKLVFKFNLLPILMPLREKYCLEIIKLNKDLLKPEVSEQEAHRLLYSATACFFGISDTIATGYHFPGTRKELEIILTNFLYPLYDHAVKDF